MLGSRIGGVKAKYAFVAALACLVVAGGCWSRRYPERLRTHTELLVSFTHKGRDLVTTGRFTAESLPELTYPLERAAAFAAEARHRLARPPASLAAFDTLVARYRAFVQLVDDARRDHDARGVAERLDAAVAGVDAAADEARRALEREA
jgi:hypothetical protein